MKIKYSRLILSLIPTMIVLIVLALFYYSFLYSLDSLEKDRKKDNDDDLSYLILDQQQKDGRKFNTIFFYG